MNAPSTEELRSHACGASRYNYLALVCLQRFFFVGRQLSRFRKILPVRPMQIENWGQRLQTASNKIPLDLDLVV